jgi:putative FmdB family regulatory protein
LQAKVGIAELILSARPLSPKRQYTTTQPEQVCVLVAIRLSRGNSEENIADLAEFPAFDKTRAKRRQLPMPAYDFLCHECETVFEERRSFMSASDPADCPACGSQKTHKLLTTFAFFSNEGTSTQAPENLPLQTSAGGCGCGSCSCGA